MAILLMAVHNRIRRPDMYILPDRHRPKVPMSAYGGATVAHASGTSNVLKPEEQPPLHAAGAPRSSRQRTRSVLVMTSCTPRGALSWLSNRFVTLPWHLPSRHDAMLASAARQAAIT